MEKAQQATPQEIVPEAKEEEMALTMRRILLLVTAALVMAAVLVAMAAPAFAQGSTCGKQTSEEAKGGGVGEISELRYPKSGLVTAEFCSPAR
jgi:hypothetical protein